MKVAPGKTDNKKRKRDDSKEAISESPKKAKVHAQRKFAQGAAFNNSVITPIKDKSRPTTATQGSGPMLTAKCPNTEDFLTFLCFRRTSILPPKLDFFKEARGSDNDSSPGANKLGVDKSIGNALTKKQVVKKNSTNDIKKKPQPAAVQALRKKYHEQRLAKQKVSNVTKLAQKVKGKNMVRTRSSVIVEDTKPMPKKRVSAKEDKTTSSSLRSGLKRVQPTVIRSLKKVVKPKHLRTGLRSGGSTVKTANKVVPAVKVSGAVIGKKADNKETKKPSIEVSQPKGKNMKLRKAEGFSDFSSDDNEPLLAVKRAKITPKKATKVMMEISPDKKEDKKPFVKTRSQAVEPEASRLVRPTRKTKEAAALYVEMITKKLVSPDKSGDDDASSVDSFPELPNAKKNEQRESEIKARALANKKAFRPQNQEKQQDAKKSEPSKTSNEVKNNNKTPQVLKKEANSKSKGAGSPVAVKKLNRNSAKNKQSGEEDEKEEQLVHRPSTRSRPKDENEAAIKKLPPKISPANAKKASLSNESLNAEKGSQSGKKAKGKMVKSTEKENESESEKSSKITSADDKSSKQGSNKNAGKNIQGKVKEKIKEETVKKAKKITGADKKDVETKNVNNKEAEKKERKDGSPVSKRPVRKCSAADKLCFEIDAFTSDEDDFDVFRVTTTRSSIQKPSSSKEKEKPKKEEEKKGGNALSVDKTTVKSESSEVKQDSNSNVAVKKVDGKKKKDGNKSNKDSSAKTEPKTETGSKKIEETTTSENEKVKTLDKENLLPTSKGMKAEDSAQTKESDLTCAKIDQTASKSWVTKATKESFLDKDAMKRTSTPSNSANLESSLSSGKKEPKKSSKKNEKDANDKKDESKKVTEKSKGKKTKNAPKNSRDRSDSVEEKQEEDDKSGRRTRPVRQCSTGVKRWIETDSDSFSFYETDEEDNLLIFELTSPENKEKSSLSLKDTKEMILVPDKDTKTTKSEKDLKEGKENENFSDSDEEPLKKKKETVPMLAEKPAETPEVKSFQPKIQRDPPGLHPLKRTPSETQMVTNATVPTPKLTLPPQITPPTSQIPLPAHNMSILNQPKPVFYEATKPNLPIVRPPPSKEDQLSPTYRSHFFMNQGSSPIVSVPNRIEMILHSLKKDRVPERPNPYSNDVKVTFGNVPYHPVAHHSSQIIPPPCNYQIKPIINIPREPISTHGLDLLSEVALPTTPNKEMNCQTERIEKWLKDSVAAEHKKSYLPYEENIQYKGKERDRMPKTSPEKQEKGLFYGKPSPSVGISSHGEVQKFGQAELTASQKLLKKNLFAAESGKIEHQQPATVKKAVTSVQDLLKLQKERKEAGKSPAENSPHLKNCKCNNCVVKKGWFKNKPVPKMEQPKTASAIDDREDSVKPFESLTKAFKADNALGKISSEGKNSKMSVTVAPIVLTSPPPPTPKTTSVSSSTSTSPARDNSNISSERKRMFYQKKMSFLERMKERERKEAAAAAKANANAFSPNNESSVYAFEPESDVKATGASASIKNKTRDSLTSTSSKSDDYCLKICEDEPSTTVSSGTQVEKSSNDGTKITLKSSQSTSIAVQVNLDCETVTEPEITPDIQDGKSIEISTQTEVPEEDSDSPMFYIPLQQSTSSGNDGSSDQQLIQGVALKLGTEGPKGPNQRVVMKAKLVTKPPDVPSMKAVVMPQPKRIFSQKSNNPPIGTVQPTTRKPPEEPKTTEAGVETLPAPKESPRSKEMVSQTSTTESPSSTSKGGKSSGSSATKSSEKVKEKVKDSGKEKQEGTEESSSSSSVTSSKSKRTVKSKGSDVANNPSNSTWMPAPGSASKMVEAPTFYATEKDFQDPFEFFERIRPAAEKFGLCRIVPPANFKPDCKVSDDMRFTAYNQYVHRMFHRWGPNIKEMMAIKKYLATQSISLKQPPWIGGIEVDLPRLYQSVQNCGGLMKVMEKKKWNQVADMMRIPKAAQDRVTKLDDIYCKYLLPYDTLSHDERQKLFDEVEKDWAERQRTSAASTDSQGEEDGEEENYIEECEECVVKGRNMALNQFYRIARNTMSMWFKNSEPSPREVENEFWRHVSERSHHVCVHSGSIDSSGWGYGFPIAKNNSFSKHPWNLKVLTNNSRSVLRSLGPAMGVTVPTLHVGMVFTAFCWYRDPHGLPWIEYLHTGAPKIWYGISDDNSNVFQEALSKLLPRYIKNKTIWLPSDTAMIPPALLVENGVSLCHTVQEPGQFILVFPRAFISSICTGYMVSESVYFAQSTWLATAEQAFKDIQESCEPSMFSLEKLLFSIATDSRSSVEVLKQVLPMVWHVRQKEVDGRKTLFNLGLKTSERMPSREGGSKKKKGRWVQDDDCDYECEVCRMNLFVSLVTNSQEEGTYCLPHAIELLTQKRQQLKYCKLMYNYSQEEMNEIVEKLEQRIESKSQKKTQSVKASTAAK